MNENNPERTGNIQAIRNEKGQFIKGVSGNPLGKPVGATNKFSPTSYLIKKGMYEED